MKNLRFQDFLGRTGGEESRFEENQPIHSGADHVDVMSDQEDGQFEFIVKVLHELDDVVLGGNIQAGSRFIQDQDLGLLGQGPGDEDALLLAAGQPGRGHYPCAIPFRPEPTLPVRCHDPSSLDV